MFRTGFELKILVSILYPPKLFFTKVIQAIAPRAKWKKVGTGNPIKTEIMQRTMSNILMVQKYRNFLTPENFG